MKDEDVARALDAQLEGVTGRPDIVVWPNEPRPQGENAPRPRLEVTFAPAEPEPVVDKLVPGGVNVHRRMYTYLVTVVTDEKAQQWEAQQFAEVLTAHFVYGMHPDIVTCPNLYVAARPATGPGFPEGREWRLPVLIRLEAVTQ